MSRPPSPPRIFIIPAAAADTAVVFRRGPSNWFHLLKWDMSRDTFEPGAWFRGSMYPEKCDISPDGSLLLYFVLQGNKSQTSYSHAWTAVSRLPWLTALGLWPQGTTYGGGGRFLANRHIVIRAGEPSPHPDHPGRNLRVDPGNPELHASKEVQGASWSGRDHHGRLIYAKQGKIFRRSANGKDKQLTDLAGIAPDPKPSPNWASRQLEAPVKRGRRDI
jgi:hypothetical protein